MRENTRKRLCKTLSGIASLGATIFYDLAANDLKDMRENTRKRLCKTLSGTCLT
ncbi:MAG: hypothetical protein ACHQJ6_05225 [Candidatus Berkiellales bacterium]